MLFLNKLTQRNSDIFLKLPCKVRKYSICTGISSMCFVVLIALAIKNAMLWHAMPHRGSRYHWSFGKFLWLSITSYPTREYSLNYFHFLTNTTWSFHFQCLLHMLKKVNIKLVTSSTACTCCVAAMAWEAAAAMAFPPAPIWPRL